MTEDIATTNLSEDALNHLSELIARIGGADEGTHSNGVSGLLLEHLQSARRNLLGSRLGEYRSSLEQAKESVDVGISDKGIRSNIKGILASLENATTVWQRNGDSK